MAGGRFKVVPCPDVSGGRLHAAGLRQRNRHDAERAHRILGHLSRCRAAGSRRHRHGASATLKMAGLTMGSGDAWPAVDLAKVLFNQSGGREFTSRQVVVGGSTDAAGLHAAKRHLQGAGPRRARRGSNHVGGRDERNGSGLRTAAQGPSPAHLLWLLRRHRQQHLRARLRGGRSARKGRPRIAKTRTRPAGTVRSRAYDGLSAAWTGPNSGDTRRGSWSSCRPRTTISTSTRPDLR